MQMEQSDTPPKSLISKVLLMMLLSSFMQSTFAVDYAAQANVRLGLDSNPHQLADSYEPVEQNYYYSDAKLAVDVNHSFYINGEIQKVDYNDDDRADWFKSAINFGYHSKFVINDNQFNYQLSADYEINDETYVYQTTGRVATFDGESIADRFDSTQINLNAEISYKNQQNTQFKIIYQNRDKAFESIAVDGLSNLDYTHNAFGLGADYQMSEQGSLLTEFHYTLRDYTNRQAKDSSGVNIPNSQLKYTYSNYQLAYRYQPEIDYHWLYTFNYTNRSDNSSGFWNSDSSYVAIENQYRFAEFHQLNAALKYSKYTYENLPDSDLVALDEQNRANQGFSLKLNYLWDLATLHESKFSLYASAEFFAYDNSNVFYEYQRTNLSIGVKWRL